MHTCYEGPCISLVWDSGRGGGMFPLTADSERAIGVGSLTYFVDICMWGWGYDAHNKTGTGASGLRKGVVAPLVCCA